MTRTLLLLIGLLGLAACGPKEQSFREGMEIICRAGDDPSLRNVNPAERQARMSEWIDQRLRNPEARKIFEGVSEVRPELREDLLGDAVKRAGLDRCPLIDQVPAAVMNVPDAPDGKLEPLPRGSTLVISATAVVIEGEAVVPVRDGKVDAAEIDKVAQYGAALAAQHPGPMLIAAAPTTPYGLLGQVVARVRPSHPDLAIVATGPDGPGTIPLGLAATMPSPGELGLVIVVTRDEIIVFSSSGQLGTFMAPHWRGPVTARDELRTALAAIPAAGDRRVTVIADGTLTAAVVVPVMAVARHSFPDIIFALGIQ